MTHALLTRIEAQRRTALGVLDQLTEQARAFELPAPPEALGRYRQRLADNTYRVLVVGEAKRGKSSFINALIGRPILPTDVDIATSQVFLVSRAAREAYRLRFEDDSAQDITAAELPRYGSQVLADVEGTPRLDQIIRWIEVDAPATFLPDGVSLLDTPGLGSLYAAHSQITQRFLPHADAVVFVLDSSQPIGQPDLETIAAILAVTPNLFFIQTRIDQFRKEQWQALQARNEQVLHERFAALPDARVWPISSANLMKAAETQDTDYEIVSRHRELAAAFKTFLFRAAGLSRAAAAIVVAGEYHGSARQVLLGRIADLTEESKERRLAVQRELAERRRQFDHDWGAGGSGRRKLAELLRQTTDAGKRTLRQALENGGEIDRAVRSRINAINTIEEANRLAETLPAEVTAAAVNKWQETERQVRQHANEYLGPFMVALDHLAQASYPALESTPSAHDRCRLETRDDLFERLKGGFIDFRNASAMAGIGGTAIYTGLGLAAGSSTTVAAFMASAAFPPVAIGVVVVAGVWALVQGVRGYQRTGESQLKRSRQELQEHLGDVRDRVRRCYFDVDLGTGRHRSLVDEHFDRLVEDLNTRLQRLAQERSEEARQEQARLADQAKLDAQQRAARLVELRGHLAHWDQTGQGLQASARALADIDDQLQALAHPGAPASYQEQSA